MQQAKIRCLECDSDYVPEVIIASIDPPEGLNVIGNPKYIEERIFQPKQSHRGEKHAMHVSESIFFIEYHLHS